MNILTEEEQKERCRLLVLENDELNAQVIKLKNVLTDIAHINTSSYFEDVKYIKSAASFVLKEMSHE